MAKAYNDLAAAPRALGKQTVVAAYNMLTKQHQPLPPYVMAGGELVTPDDHYAGRAVRVQAWMRSTHRRCRG